MGAAPALTRPGFARPWVGVLLPPAAWASDLLLRYALVEWTCENQATFVLQLISIVTMLLVCCGALAAWRTFREAPRDAATDGGRPADSSRFMGALGLLMSGTFAVIVIAGAIPQWILDACH